MNLFGRHYVTILIVLISLSVIEGVIFIIYNSRRKRKGGQALDEA